MLRRLMTIVVGVFSLCQVATAQTPLQEAADEALRWHQKAVAAYADALTERTACLQRFGWQEPDPMEYPSWTDAEDDYVLAKDYLEWGETALTEASDALPNQQQAIQHYDQAAQRFAFAVHHGDEAACIYRGISPAQANMLVNRVKAVMVGGVLFGGE